MKHTKRSIKILQICIITLLIISILFSFFEAYKIIIIWKLSIQTLLMLISFLMFIFLIVIVDIHINYDTMTLLGNRSKMFSDVKLLMKQKRKFAVCYIDFNSFKKINDTYGHKAGDDALIEFGKKMRKIQNLPIKGYRMGGDEFVLLITKMNLLDECLKGIQNINGSKIKVETYTGEKCDIILTFASGIFVANNYTKLSVEQIIKEADKNMYYDKKQTKEQEI